MKLARHRRRWRLGAAGAIAAAAFVMPVTAGTAAAEQPAQQWSGPYQSCDDASHARPDGMITIKRADTVNPDKRWEKRRAYNITAELFPPYNAPGWGTQTGFVRVYVNGKPTNSTIGRTKPTSEIQHGRFNAWDYQNAGDAPWTDHKVSGGDIIRLEWAAGLVGAKGEAGGVYGSLSCRA